MEVKTAVIVKIKEIGNFTDNSLYRNFNGEYNEVRILNAPIIKRGFEKGRISKITIELFNGDKKFTDDLRGKEIIVELWENEDLQDIFIGNISSIEFNDETYKIEAEDKLWKPFLSDFPYLKVDRNKYPNALSDDIDKPIPIVFGKSRVRCLLVDEKTNKYVIACHNVNVERVYVNGIETNSSNNPYNIFVDNNDGYTYIQFDYSQKLSNGNYAVVEVIANGLDSNPVNALYTLLTSNFGFRIPSILIDSTTFDSNRGTSLRIDGVIDEIRKGFEWINEFLIVLNATLTRNKNKKLILKFDEQKPIKKTIDYKDIISLRKSFINYSNEVNKYLCYFGYDNRFKNYLFSYSYTNDVSINQLNSINEKIEKLRLVKDFNTALKVSNIRFNKIKNQKEIYHISLPLNLDIEEGDRIFITNTFLGDLDLLIQSVDKDDVKINVIATKYDETIYTIIPEDNYPKATLISNISEIDTVIPVDDTSKLPDAGIVIIGDELIYYQSKTQTTLENCIRGYLNTPNIVHNSGEIAYLVQMNLNTYIDSTSGYSRIQEGIYDEGLRADVDNILSVNNAKVYFTNQGIQVIDGNDSNKWILINQNGITLTVDGGTTFRVAIKPDGIEGATIRAGTITADKLSINQLSELTQNAGIIVSGKLQNASGSSYIDLDGTTGNFIYVGNGNFKVDVNGNVYANNGYFQGTVVSNNGNIGNLKITTGGLSSVNNNVIYDDTGLHVVLNTGDVFEARTSDIIFRSGDWANVCWFKPYLIQMQNNVGNTLYLAPNYIWLNFTNDPSDFYYSTTNIQIGSSSKPFIVYLDTDNDGVYEVSYRAYISGWG